MKIPSMPLGLFFGLVACGGSTAPNPQAASSASSIRAAEEVGAVHSPQASLHLQLAKEQAQQAKRLENEGEHEEASLLLMRAEADGELATALARTQADESLARQARDKTNKQRRENSTRLNKQGTL